MLKSNNMLYREILEASTLYCLKRAFLKFAVILFIVCLFLLFIVLNHLSDRKPCFHLPTHLTRFSYSSLCYPVLLISFAFTRALFQLPHSVFTGRQSCSLAIQLSPCCRNHGLVNSSSPSSSAWHLIPSVLSPCFTAFGTGSGWLLKALFETPFQSGFALNVVAGTSTTNKAETRTGPREALILPPFRRECIVDSVQSLA